MKLEVTASGANGKTLTFKFTTSGALPNQNITITSFSSGFRLTGNLPIIIPIVGNVATLTRNASTNPTSPPPLTQYTVNFTASGMAGTQSLTFSY